MSVSPEWSSLQNSEIDATSLLWSSADAVGVVVRRQFFGPYAGPGRPGLTGRLTRLSVAGVPERFRTFVAKSGGAVDVTLDGTLATLSSALAGNTAPPDFNHAVVGQLAPLAGALTATTAAPAFDHTLAGVLAPLAGAITVTRALPDFNHALGGDLPKLAGAIACTAAAPDFDHTMVGALPKLDGALAGTAAAPGIDGTLASPLPKLAGAISGTATAPQFDAVVSGPLAALSAVLTGNAAAPQFDSAVDGALAALTGSITSMSGAYGVELASTFAGLSGRFYERTPTVLVARYREPRLVFAYALELQLVGRAGEISAIGRVPESRLSARIVDEET